MESTVADLPADFEQRSAVMRARLCAGERMTVEHLAAELGVTAGFLATAIAVYCAVTDRRPVLVDLSHARPLH